VCDKAGALIVRYDEHSTRAGQSKAIEDQRHLLGWRATLLAASSSQQEWTSHIAVLSITGMFLNSCKQLSRTKLEARLANIPGL
jgi:hypothetical protein